VVISFLLPFKYVRFLLALVLYSLLIIDNLFVVGLNQSQVEPSIDYDRIYLPPVVGAANPGARDPWAWRWAKMCVQSADWNHLEVAAHLTMTHLVEEVFVISTHRSLHPSHPLHQLLLPHFDRTLALNDAARRILIPIYLQNLSSLGASGVMELAGKVFSDFDFQANYVPRELASRDCADLEDWGYFYGPDSRAIWQAIAVYCHKVIFDVYERYNHPTHHFHLHYLSHIAYDLLCYSDAELKVDIQVQRWCDEIIQRGRVKNFPTSFAARTDLVEALTMIIFLASAQHTAVNYLQEWYLSYVPSRYLSLKPACMRALIVCTALHTDVMANMVCDVTSQSGYIAMWSTS
jgi:hypothetical protein